MSGVGSAEVDKTARTSDLEYAGECRALPYKVHADIALAGCGAVSASL